MEVDLSNIKPRYDSEKIRDENRVGKVKDDSKDRPRFDSPELKEEYEKRIERASEAMESFVEKLIDPNFSLPEKEGGYGTIDTAAVKKGKFYKDYKEVLSFIADLPSEDVFSLVESDNDEDAIALEYMLQNRDRYPGPYGVYIPGTEYKIGLTIDMAKGKDRFSTSFDIEKSKSVGKEEVDLTGYKDRLNAILPSWHQKV